MLSLEGLGVFLGAETPLRRRSARFWARNRR